MLQEEKEIIKVRSRRRGPVCIIIGLSLIVGVITVQLMDYYNEKALLSTMEQLLQEETKVPSGETIQELPVTEAPAIQEENGPETEQLLGVVKIPCIELETPLVEGTDKKSLRSAVGHMEGTAMPGEETGNCVIAGHRNYSFGRFFNRLDEMEIEDEIEIVMVSGEVYTYRVDSIAVVGPEDMSVLSPDKEPSVTLITCTPIYIASHRLIVKAKLIKF